MHLLVKYTVNEGKADAQRAALNALVAGLKKEGNAGFDYTGFETDDPTQFIAILRYDDDAAKQRFLDTAAFKEYRDSAKDRFPGPPSTTAMRKVASTKG